MDFFPKNTLLFLSLIPIPMISKMDLILSLQPFMPFSIFLRNHGRLLLDSSTFFLDIFEFNPFFFKVQNWVEIPTEKEGSESSKNDEKKMWLLERNFRLFGFIFLSMSKKNTSFRSSSKSCRNSRQNKRFERRTFRFSFFCNSKENQIRSNSNFSSFWLKKWLNILCLTFNYLNSNLFVGWLAIFIKQQSWNSFLWFIWCFHYLHDFVIFKWKTFSIFYFSVFLNREMRSHEFLEKWNMIFQKFKVIISLIELEVSWYYLIELFLIEILFFSQQIWNFFPKLKHFSTFFVFKIERRSFDEFIYRHFFVLLEKDAFLQLF